MLWHPLGRLTQEAPLASNTPGIMSAFSVALCLLVCAQSGAPCEALAKAPEASGDKGASDDAAKADKAA